MTSLVTVDGANVRFRPLRAYEDREHCVVSGYRPSLLQLLRRPKTLPISWSTAAADGGIGHWARQAVGRGRAVRAFGASAFARMSSACGNADCTGTEIRRFFAVLPMYKAWLRSPSSPACRAERSSLRLKHLRSRDVKVAYRIASGQPGRRDSGSYAIACGPVDAAVPQLRQMGETVSCAQFR